MKKWVKNGFLNKDIKLPLGNLGAMRTQIEADLLLQNLMLTADSMGLGAWIHASISPPVLLGDPKFRKRYGSMLDFDWVIPKWKPVDILRWGVPLPMAADIRANAVGLRRLGEPLIKAHVPAELPDDGRRRRRRARRQVRPATASTPTRRCSSASTRASSATATSRRPATTPTT